MALTGGLIAPGIAGAAEGDSTETVTQDGQFEMTATGNDDCTVDFTLTNLYEEYPGTPGGPFWRGHYQVDDEPSNMGDQDSPVYRPVLASAQETIDAINGRYDIEKGAATVDLRDDRVVPTNNDDTVTLPGVTPADGGSHEVSFGVYQGPGGYYGETKTVTVTGCEGDGSGSVGSLDIFGSLGDLGAGSLEGLLPEFE